jgi:hypothetical protein
MMSVPLAEAAARLAMEAEPVEGGLRFASVVLPLGIPDSRPFFEDQVWRRRLDAPLRLVLNALVASAPRIARVQGFRLGPFAFVGTPADLGVGIALAAKEKARSLGILHPVIASQTDGYIGYLHLRHKYRKSPPPSHLGMAQYENAMNFFGRDTGDRVLGAVGEVLRRLAG